jgi:hypothetical protein
MMNLCRSVCAILSFFLTHYCSCNFQFPQMRSVLIKWSESVLEIPKLFQLGYGGVSAPVPEAGLDDDVSSWGGDEVENSRHSRKPKKSGPNEDEDMNEEVVHKEDDEQKEEEDDEDEDYPSTEKKPEDLAVQRERKRRFVAEKRVLLKPRLSLNSSAASDADYLNPPSKHVADNKKQPDTASMSEEDDDENPSTQPNDEYASRDKIPAKLRVEKAGTSDEEVARDDDDKEEDWSETQDPDEEAALAAQPEAVSDQSGVEETGKGEKQNGRREKTNGKKRQRQHSKKTAAGPKDTKEQRNGSDKKTVTKEMKQRKDAAKTEANGKKRSPVPQIIRAAKRRKPVIKRARVIAETEAPQVDDRNPKPAAGDRKNDARKQPLFADEEEDIQLSGPEPSTTRSQTSPVVQRWQTTPMVPFSEEEIDAIRKGVERFGVGHWNNIKMHDVRLRHRDTIQIKNTFRNMLRSNQL